MSLCWLYVSLKVSKWKWTAERAVLKFEANIINQRSYSLHAGLILSPCMQVVDLDALRELCWSGVPADLRPLCWRLLSGYLPPNRDRRCTAGY